MAIGAQTAAVEVPSPARFAIKANVVVAVLLATALLVGANWFGSLKSYRRDVTSLGGYGLSDRTRGILAGTQHPVDISILYMPDPENENQQRYITRLQDYCDELERASSKVKVTFVNTDSQRERLVTEISSAFGGEATKHREALDTFNRVKEETQADLEQRLQAAEALVSGDTWIADFPLFASIIATLKSDLESLKKAADEIRELTPAGGIPKYADATRKAKTALDEIKGHLETVARRLSELATLSDETTRPDSRNMAMLREVAAESESLVASLRQTIGSEDGPQPGDTARALKAFADRGNEVGAQLERLVRRVDEFARRFPMIRQHPNWATQAQLGPLLTRVEVADVLQQIGQTLSKTRLMILGAIDSKDPEQLRQALASVRRNMLVLEKNAEICATLLKEMTNRLANLDAGSKTLLESARNGTMYADRIAAIAALSKQIDELPELKLGSIADQLKEDNAIVVQTGGKIRVVGFNEVFPVRESVGGAARSEEAVRTFNGDGAISSAILALSQEKAFATVMLVSFEPPPPPQRSQFSPPPQQSWVPSGQLSTLRSRLEGANFKVIDWNMATTKDEPPGEADLPKIYVLLPPPPPALPNPFSPQPSPDQQFGEAQRQKIRALLDEDARMIFVGSWEIRSLGMFGGPPMTPPYGYQEVLENDWGITMDNSRRVVWVDPNRRQVNSFGVIPRKFLHMPVSGFTNHEIGAPMRGTRFLINDACPLEFKRELPEGVTISPVLQIPDREDYIAADVKDLIRIIEVVQNPASEGWIDLGHPPQRGPFTIIAAAQRSVGDKSKGKIVVTGCGASIREDYLNGPVWTGGDRLKLDPPPSENADLFINALYWLQGRPELISKGPVPVPRVLPIEAGELTALRWFVWGIWPALVLIPGIMLWYVRRR